MTDSSVAIQAASSNALSVLSATPAIILFGVPLGLHLDVLVWGIVGSAFFLLLHKPKPEEPKVSRFQTLSYSIKRVCLAILSSLVAGGSAPALHDLLERFMAGIPQSVTYLIAIVVGFGAQSLLPKAVESIPNLFSRLFESVLKRIAPSETPAAAEPSKTSASPIKVPDQKEQL